MSNNQQGQGGKNPQQGNNAGQQDKASQQNQAGQQGQQGGKSGQQTPNGGVHQQEKASGGQNEHGSNIKDKHQGTMTVLEYSRIVLCTGVSTQFEIVRTASEVCVPTGLPFSQCS